MSDIYATMTLILERIDSEGDLEVEDFSPQEEKAIALLVRYRAVTLATRTTPNILFAGETFSEILELGPEKYISLAEKLSPAVAPPFRKKLNSQLLLYGAVGALIGGSIAGIMWWLLACG